MTYASAKGKPGGGGGGKPKATPLSVVIEEILGVSELLDDGGGAYVTDKDVKTKADLNAGSGALNVDINTSKKKFSGRTVCILLPSSVLFEVGIPGFANTSVVVPYMPEQVAIETGPAYDLRTIAVGDIQDCR